MEPSSFTPINKPNSTVATAPDGGGDDDKNSPPRPSHIPADETEIPLPDPCTKCGKTGPIEQFEKKGPSPKTPFFKECLDCRKERNTKERKPGRRSTREQARGSSPSPTPEPPRKTRRPSSPLRSASLREFTHRPPGYEWSVQRLEEDFDRSYIADDASGRKRRAPAGLNSDQEAKEKPIHASSSSLARAPPGPLLHAEEEREDMEKVASRRKSAPTTVTTAGRHKKFRAILDAPNPRRESASAAATRAGRLQVPLTANAHAALRTLRPEDTPRERVGEDPPPPSGLSGAATQQNPFRMKRRSSIFMKPSRPPPPPRNSSKSNAAAPPSATVSYDEAPPRTFIEPPRRKSKAPIALRDLQPFNEAERHKPIGGPAGPEDEGKTKCLNCQRSILQCDFDRPQCARCRSNMFTCEYPEDFPKGK
ncbi:hypothetical protein H2203_003376 [Taxawa tesnikishii (nom. ined.)]|nr:hypothetical protein H2203_003376 [Dothideales sp. JES 119]